MVSRFEELAFHPSPMGNLILRRRRVPALEDREVYEVILGEAFLMSSSFTVVEVALADLGLAACVKEMPLEVLVGGLGLGYTAAAALKHPNVCSMQVIETLAPVIDWHRRGLVPLGKSLSEDSRCELIKGDFFAMALASEDSFGPLDALLLDIDHTPSKLLDPSHARFYEVDGLAKVSGKIKQHGVFAMWSDDPVDDAFMGNLQAVFPSVEAHTVSFENLLQGGESFSTVYVARRSLS